MRDGTICCKIAVDDANRELAPFQQIRYWLRWPQPEFPRTSTGKVLRRTVQGWAQQSLGRRWRCGREPLGSSARGVARAGSGKREVTSSDRLAEDLHLDSLAMVQLQSTLETRFGMELDDAVWGQVKNGRRSAGTVANGSPCEWQPAAGPRNRRRRRWQQPPSAVPCRVIPSQRERLVFPRWPWWPVVRLLRAAFLEGVMRPLLWLVLGPRIAPPVLLARPSLLIANHLTAFDVPVILYALSSKTGSTWRSPCLGSC